MPILLLTVPVIATLLGGWMAIRLRRSLHILLGVSAGLLLGAAFLDLLPEALSIGRDAGLPLSRPLSIALVSFLFFFVLEAALDALRSKANKRVAPHTAGRVAGSMLIFHSFRDGMAIGAALTASPGAGFAVAVGIAAHDIGDGMNSVILTTAGDKPRAVDYIFLAADALAPLAGGLVALRWFGSGSMSTALLATAAGFFLQMAASDFLPQVRQSGLPRLHAVLSVLGGVAIIYGANVIGGLSAHGHTSNY